MKCFLGQITWTILRLNSIVNLTDGVLSLRPEISVIKYKVTLVFKLPSSFLDSPAIPRYIEPMNILGVSV